MLVGVFAVVVQLVGVLGTSGPNPIYDAAKYSTLVAKVPNGVLYKVDAPGSEPLDLLHVFGSAHERGLAHGRLTSAKMLDFLNVQMPIFFVQQAAALAGELDKLPKWLAALIRYEEVVCTGPTPPYPISPPHPTHPHPTPHPYPSLPEPTPGR